MEYCKNCKKFLDQPQIITHSQDEHTYDCITDKCAVCNNYIVTIDDDIAPMIKILNNKGYSTVWSCSGHPDFIQGGYYETYIIIELSYDDFYKANHNICDKQYEYLEICPCNVYDIDDNEIKGTNICIKRTVLNDRDNEFSYDGLDEMTNDQIVENYRAGMRVRLELIELINNINPIN